MMALLLLLLLVAQLQLVSPFSIRAPPPSSSPSSPSPPLQRNNPNNIIQVTTVNSNDDILALADLRYQEWMANDPNPPKLSSFRMATAEIYHERRMEGSVVFLATMLNGDDNDDDDGIVDGQGVDKCDGTNNGGVVVVTIGAAELSPIELQGVFRTHDEKGNTDNNTATKSLYITDVVTSSSHRRLGIGSELMTALERKAWEMESKLVFLHVAHDNVGARRFYERLGYDNVWDCEDNNVDTEVEGREAGDDSHDGMVYFSLEEPSMVTSTPSKGKQGIITMDAKRLAVNASTIGQQLMMKRIPSEPIPLYDKEVQLQSTTTISTQTTTTTTAHSSTAAKGGFGNKRTVRSSKQKQKKRKR